MTKYNSKYSPGKEVTDLQYICELICEKNAKQTGRELPAFFWQLEQWSQFYKSQLRQAKKLLDNYDSSAIIKALRDKRTNKVYSLFAPWLPKIIAEYQSKIDKAPKVVEETAPVKSSMNFKRPDKKTLLDKLDE